MSVSLPAARGEVRHGNQDLVEGAEAPVRWEEAGTVAARQDDRSAGDDAHVLSSSQICQEIAGREGP
jgi:hypothetical protein